MATISAIPFSRALSPPSRESFSGAQDLRSASLCIGGLVQTPAKTRVRREAGRMRLCARVRSSAGRLRRHGTARLPWFVASRSRGRLLRSSTATLTPISRSRRRFDPPARVRSGPAAARPPRPNRSNRRSARPRRSPPLLPSDALKRRSAFERPRPPAAFPEQRPTAWSPQHSVPRACARSKATDGDGRMSKTEAGGRRAGRCSPRVGAVTRYRSNSTPGAGPRRFSRRRTGA